MSLSTTEHAAALRQTLKTRYGWTSRQVSIRAEYYSMGSSLHVVVKDPTVPLGIVTTWAEQAERIDRCAITGDILGGGNRYVHVSYSREAAQAVGAPYVAAVSAAAAACVDTNSLEPVADTPFLVGQPQRGRLSLWDTNSHVLEAYEPETLAQAIGQRMVEAAYASR